MLFACGCAKIGNKILKDCVYDIIFIEIKEHFHEVRPRGFILPSEKDGHWPLATWQATRVSPSLPAVQFWTPLPESSDDEEVLSPLVSSTSQQSWRYLSLSENLTFPCADPLSWVDARHKNLCCEPASSAHGKINVHGVFKCSTRRKFSPR
jgi:hypothetical protein